MSENAIATHTDKILAMANEAVNRFGKLAAEAQRKLRDGNGDMDRAGASDFVVGVEDRVCHLQEALALFRAAGDHDRTYRMRIAIETEIRLGRAIAMLNDIPCNLPDVAPSREITKAQLDEWRGTLRCIVDAAEEDMGQLDSMLDRARSGFADAEQAMRTAIAFKSKADAAIDMLLDAPVPMCGGAELQWRKDMLNRMREGETLAIRRAREVCAYAGAGKVGVA